MKASCVKCVILYSNHCYLRQQMNSEHNEYSVPVDDEGSKKNASTDL